MGLLVRACIAAFGLYIRDVEICLYEFFIELCEPGGCCVSSDTGASGEYGTTHPASVKSVITPTSSLVPLFTQAVMSY